MRINGWKKIVDVYQLSSHHFSPFKGRLYVYSDQQIGEFVKPDPMNYGSYDVCNDYKKTKSQSYHFQFVNNGELP
jgi:hypothetical protein